MKIALAILIVIHGTIHLFGFFKAFGIREFKAIQKPISKKLGIVWLTTFVLFTVTVFALLWQFSHWWWIAFLSVLTSQFLVFYYWSDAKFGTIANSIILITIVVGYSTVQFETKVEKERKELFQKSEKLAQKVITKEEVERLPNPVKKWLTYSGVIGEKTISKVRLKQELQLKMKVDQKEWSLASADQYFTIEPPAFNWKLRMSMNSMIEVVGRDKFENGKGEMEIKMFSVIPMAGVENTKKVNQASLQRYLAEIVWFPTAALSPHIKWEQIDNQSAKATLRYKGTEGSGIFHFDGKGNFESFTAMRYKDVADKTPKLWTVKSLKTEERNSVKIPIECQVSWRIEDKDWTWLKVKITEIGYDL